MSCDMSDIRDITTRIVRALEYEFDGDECLRELLGVAYGPMGTYGWVCPRCGIVHAPWDTTCICPPQEASDGTE